jgi:diguanylate cyclase (GGDEF)-like protein
VRPDPAQGTGRQQHDLALDAQVALFEAAINTMSQGLCMFDADQRVVLVNRRYAELYALRPDQVQPGTTLRAILEARAATGIYSNIDAEKFVREGVGSFQQRVTQILHLADGRVISVVRIPMPGGGLVSTHEDITERETLSAKLATQHERLAAILANLPQGVCLFDKKRRVIVSNSRYAEMYKLTPDEVKPGTHVREIIERRIAKGLYAGANPEEYRRERSTPEVKPANAIHKLSDGRTIAYAVRPTSDGGGVATHEDVTEREKLRDCLNAALNNMVQGLAMFDAQFRLVIANDRYAEMYDLPQELIAPGTPLREILAYRVAQGQFGTQDLDSLLQPLQDQLSNNKAAFFVNEQTDGRFIAIAVQPMNDAGWVTTHQDITEQRRSEAKIEHMALHDPLTGLPNRALHNERLEQALTRAKRGDIVATHILDLDRFKHVNDTLGHPVGDELLKLVANRLRALVRETDTVARMGGDEFAILQVAVASPADATSLAHRLIKEVSEPYEIDGHQVVIGTSVGIAVGPSEGTSSGALMRNADLALYRAKGDGRGTFRFFEPGMDAQMQARRTLEYDLRKALAAGQFEMHYQPVVNLAEDEISGFEALIRWRHPEKGLVSPEKFIPLAEEIGLIVPIGEWTIREACAAAARWPDHLRIAVNLSPAQFRSPGLVQVVVGALATSGLRPGRLELEITETALLADSNGTLATLHQLRELGVRIAMDDFGTGYSSLSYLQSFPFDKIKIDRSFVRDIAGSAGSLNIVRAVAALANGLGMAATAEGVETEQQLAAIRSEGCTEMQGFLFSQPLPVSEVEHLLRCNRGEKKLNGRVAAA